MSAFGCLVASAVLTAMDEFVRPITLPMLPVVFALKLLGGLAVGVLSVFAGDGVFLLKKLLSGEVLLVLIWLLEGDGDVDATPTPVGVAELAWGIPVPAASLVEALPKRLLEGLRIPEVTFSIGLGEIELLVTLGDWVGLAAAVPLGVLLTLGDRLELDEAGRLAAGWLVRLPPSALLLLLSAKTGSANRGSNKASAMPTCDNFAFAVLYLPVNMADLLNYLQPFIP